MDKIKIITTPPYEFIEEVEVTGNSITTKRIMSKDDYEKEYVELHVPQQTEKD